MIEIISLVLNFVLGSSLVLFYSSSRRKHAAEACSAEMEAKQTEFDIHRQSVEFLSNQLSEAYTEIDKMQDIINDKRLQILELIRRTNQLEIEILANENIRQRLTILSCRRQQCDKREACEL